jgi:hypothetical protein
LLAPLHWLTATDRLDHVVDTVHAAIRDHAFLHEDVMIELSQWTAKPARIVQAPNTVDPSFAPPHLAAGFVRIRWMTPFGEMDSLNPPEVMKVSRIKRDRIAFSKQNFKRFLKENMTRELWAGAPLVVKVRADSEEQSEFF